ncbi:MAG: DegT/DnrJ/EryC1/StrS family aminotransferase, partial [Candidatus Sungbacteria bacterium]|nr:DegT/DnrJ/EryC1/StrS family aminotransferase [Candidatus Sungbacteria bacterium]
MDKIDYQLGVGAVNISEKSKRYVEEVLKTNRLSYGSFSRRFEQAMATAHACCAAVFMNSGTSALQVAVMALREKYNWQDGDEIIVPAVTFVASSNVILQANLKPVFVDVHPQYYNIDPALIEKAITPRTRAIMVVHLFGQSADMDPIMVLASKYNLRVIEDSCETMFARYKGKSVGSFGDVSCFSTYACHVICTGVGGLAMTTDPEIGVLLRSLANHGRDSIYMSIDDDKTTDVEKLGMIMERRFSFIRMGYSYRATEMEAALGLAQVEDISSNIGPRRRNAQVLLEKLARWKKYLQLPAIMDGAEHSFMMFPLVV